MSGITKDNMDGVLRYYKSSHTNGWTYLKLIPYTMMAACSSRKCFFVWV